MYTIDKAKKYQDEVNIENKHIIAQEVDDALSELFKVYLIKLVEDNNSNALDQGIEYVVKKTIRSGHYSFVLNWIKQQDILDEGVISDLKHRYWYHKDGNTYFNVNNFLNDCKQNHIKLSKALVNTLKSDNNSIINSIGINYWGNHDFIFFQLLHFAKGYIVERLQQCGYDVAEKRRYILLFPTGTKTVVSWLDEKNK